MVKTAKPRVQQSTRSVRKAPVEKRSTDLTRQYARILGEQGAGDRRLSDVVRACLRAIARRLPLGSRVQREAEALLERVVRLGELGALDLIGSPRAIAEHIAAMLHEEPLDPRSVYRVLRALLDQTALVEHPSRQVWALRLSGLSDPSSPLHRTLLAETPSPYYLSERPDEPAAASREVHRQDPVNAMRVELDNLRRTLSEEHRRLSRMEAELVTLREQLAVRMTADQPQDLEGHRAVDRGDDKAAGAAPTESDSPFERAPSSESDEFEAEPQLGRTSPDVVPHVAGENASSVRLMRSEGVDIEADDAPDSDDEGDEADDPPQGTITSTATPASADIHKGRRKRKRRRRRAGPSQAPRP